jgi:hypothetical protein
LPLEYDSRDRFTRVDLVMSGDELAREG